jgi:hypothetical protein
MTSSAGRSSALHLARPVPSRGLPASDPTDIGRGCRERRGDTRPLTGRPTPTDALAGTAASRRPGPEGGAPWPAAERERRTLLPDIAGARAPPAIRVPLPGSPSIPIRSASSSGTRSWLDCSPRRSSVSRPRRRASGRRTGSGCCARPTWSTSRCSPSAAGWRTATTGRSCSLLPTGPGWRCAGRSSTSRNGRGTRSPPTSPRPTRRARPRRRLGRRSHRVRRSRPNRRPPTRALPTAAGWSTSSPPANGSHSPRPASSRHSHGCHCGCPPWRRPCPRPGGSRRSRTSSPPSVAGSCSPGSTAGCSSGPPRRRGVPTSRRTRSAPRSGSAGDASPPAASSPRRLPSTRRVWSPASSHSTRACRSRAGAPPGRRHPRGRTRPRSRRPTGC